MFARPAASSPQGQLFILIPDETDWHKTEETLAALAGLAPGRVWLAGACRFDGDDRARLNRLADLGAAPGAPMLATNDVLYHNPERRVLQDVVTCIREHLTIVEAGRRLEQNAERHLKPPREMARLFAEHPEALAETAAFARPHRLFARRAQIQLSRRKPSAMARRRRRRWSG